MLLTTDVKVLNHVLFENCAISSDRYCWQISSNDPLITFKIKLVLQLLNNYFNM